MSRQSAVRTSVVRQSTALAGAAVERARLTVVPRRRTQATKIPFVALITVLLLGGVVGLLMFNTSMQQSSFTATDLEQRATVLSARQEALESRLEQLRDPQEIAARAQKLGMRVPSAPLFLDLSDGKVEGDVAAAQVGAQVRLNPLPPRRPTATTKVSTTRPPEGVLAGTGGREGGRPTGDQVARQNRGKHKNQKNDQKTDPKNGQDSQQKSDTKKQKSKVRGSSD
ncbi:hypothetical protein [Nocardioides acrostichi]|uniref:Cell division protein FtsL n=1 Tax=Nocardioides acrostichi TaxID=2784339 RepID=A0A930UTM9_9ACTN|nr:hypothetical protein [Nocardioides acrostichi]MBF4160618.1 hypothetical protein [Nocardioides acrostichi]